MQKTQFGPYTLLTLLGRGHTGEAWRAHDSVTDRIVALKLLPAHLTDDDTFQASFRREARAAAALNEPHVVPIHGYGEIDGRLYVDMRLVDGTDLGGLLGHGGLAPARAVAIVEQIGSVLHAAHEAGLVHRDVRPSNVIVGKSDFAYLTGLGIVRDAAETGSGAVTSPTGAWAYLAPERFGPGEPDARSDVYALACVLHQCLTGQRPFPGDRVEQQVAGHLSSPPPVPSSVNRAVPTAFDGVIARGMAKDPGRRFATAAELTDAARAALSDGWQPNPVSAELYSSTTGWDDVPRASGPPERSVPAGVPEESPPVFRISMAEAAPVDREPQSNPAAAPELPRMPQPAYPPRPSPPRTSPARGFNAPDRSWRWVWPVVTGVVLLAVVCAVYLVESPGVASGPADSSTAEVIRKAKVGDCVTTSGVAGAEVDVAAASCGSARATDSVTMVTDRPADCPGRWVQNVAPSKPTVVLCITALPRP